MGEFEDALEGNNDALLEVVRGLHKELAGERQKVRRLEARLHRRHKNPRTHLVIGDSHCRPGVPNDRYTWLGRFVNDHPEIDVVIDIGDWADMESLCSYDEGKGSFEGRRVLEDIECARDARERFAAEIEDFNLERGDKPARRYISCGGNHDQGRIDRVLDENPQFHGLFSVEALGATEYGWEYYPFLEPAIVDGIAYAHYFSRGDKRFAIGGINAARNMLVAGGMSCVAGHSHQFSLHEQLRADHRRMFALQAGCYLDPKQEEVYAGPPQRGNWWKGLILIKHVVDGYGEVTKIPIHEIKDKYG